MSEFVDGSEPEPVVEDGAGRGTQGAGGELGFSSGGRAVPAGVPDPELVQRASRRRYSAKYKLAIVREADACERPGEIGALLRREGLYSSHLGKWRAQRDAGALGALEPKPRGPRAPSADAVEVDKLRGELDRSRADLATARRVIKVQVNVSALLEKLLPKSATATDERRPQR